MSCARCGALASGDGRWYLCSLAAEEELELCHRCFMDLELWMAQPKQLTMKQICADIEVRAINLLEEVRRMNTALREGVR